MDEAVEHGQGPAIGEPAPCFETAVGDSSISLRDFRGSWIIIFSHPDDILPLFKTRTVNYILCKRRTKVVALVREKGDEVPAGRNFLKKYILKHRLSVLGDPEKRIEALYGLENSEEDGVKGTFIIDQKGILRAKLHSPIETERDLYEMVRLVDALQQADRQKASRPETGSWRRRLKIVIRTKTAEQS